MLFANYFCEPIAVTRLQITRTLRYLASEDSMKSLSYAFRIARNTISKIIYLIHIFNIYI